MDWQNITPHLLFITWYAVLLYFFVKDNQKNNAEISHNVYEDYVT
jgi:hypothetical protein